MKSRIFFSTLCFLIMTVVAGNSMAQTLNKDKSEVHRPQIHFSPNQNWMNDPNGMVYHEGIYHLFYQYHPYSAVWGPMHWGHATSSDLIHWNREPVAMFPDSLGTIFSGSVVVDNNNTSGFGKNGKPPLVAIFTHHNSNVEKAGRIDYQYQSIAYSLDEGKTWTKYKGNPVLKNPGIKDFRDPKVMWYDEEKKWIMTLATLDHITFYSSKDLKSWTKESEFGKEVGAHGGVWECPDLFPLYHKGQKIWVLLVSINPGGPNGGSATQYFTGQFDGKTFTPYQTDTRWLDYGTDNYAGITWSNTGDRKIFLGWMSNWQYAKVVPTEKWRGAATIPRDLGLEKKGEKYFVTSQPVKELSSINAGSIILENIAVTNYDLTKRTGKLKGPSRVTFSSDKIRSFLITLSNDAEEKVVIGYDQATDSYFVDRTHSGKVSFEKGFAVKHTAPRLTSDEKFDLTLIIDNASLELFADNGLAVMTEIFFPNKPYNQIHIQSADNIVIKKLEFMNFESIWD